MGKALTSSAYTPFFQAGVTHLIQHQFEELAKQNVGGNLVSGENKRRKLMVIGQDCMEPLQALRNAGHEVVNLKINFLLFFNSVPLTGNLLLIEQFYIL